MSADDVIGLLSANLPSVFRWAGGIARELRRHDIAVGGKTSGVADTDALTLADLSVQDLLVGALRDLGPLVRQCRIEAEEVSGDLGRFAKDGELTLAIDPIDGTRIYRDRAGNDYAVMLHLRTPDDILYSLVYFPEDGAEGLWLEARADRILLGPDDHTRPARSVLDTLPPITAGRRHDSRRILVAGFMGRERPAARAVTTAGFDGLLGGDTGGSLYPLLARGELGGALVHTPNVYDFPVAMHVVRILGGDAVWTHDGRRVDFRTVWRDERASMLRLPGIVACAVDRAMIPTLVGVARDWSRESYVA